MYKVYLKAGNESRIVPFSKDMRAGREFHDETACIASGQLIPLAPVKLKNGRQG